MAVIGNEVFDVTAIQINGQLAATKEQVTLAQVASLSGSNSGDSAVTIATAGDGVLTAAGITAGIINRTGPTADFTDTTDTAAAIYAANPNVGATFYVWIKNTTAFKETLAGGTGVTPSTVVIVPPNSAGLYLFTITSATAVSFQHIVASTLSPTPPAYLIGTPDNGTTQTLTAVMVAGSMNVTHVSIGGTTPSLTMPLATAIIAAMANWRIGQSYKLRVINSNSGTATVVTNTGITTSGTLTLATNTWREFIITMTAAATVSMTNVGTGTNS